MHRNKTLTILMASIVAALASAATLADLANIEVFEPGGISGFSGNQKPLDVIGFKYRLSNEPGTRVLEEPVALTAITWSERGDRPCHMMANGNFINPAFKLPEGAMHDSGQFTLDLCNGAKGSTKTVKFTNPRYFVQGVAVCTNGASDSSKARLKGIRIFGAEIGSDGAVHAMETTPEQNMFVNCKEPWHPAVMCLADQLAVGLVVNYKTDGQSKNAIAGLGLKCRKPGKPGVRKLQR